MSQDGPPGSVKRVRLQERFDGWARSGLAWLFRKLVARALGSAGTVSEPLPAQAKSAVPLYRDPWCGTYVSPEISFSLEQAGQMLHFCSAECRAKYRGSSQRAASA